MNASFQKVAKNLEETLEEECQGRRLIFAWTGAEDKEKNILQVAVGPGPVCNIRDLTKDPSTPLFMVVSLGDIEGDGCEIFNNVDGEQALQSTVKSLINRIPS